MESMTPYGDNAPDQKGNEEMIRASISDFSHVLSQLIDLDLESHYTVLSGKDVEAIRLCACFTRSNINRLLKQ